MKIFISGYPHPYDELALAQLVGMHGDVRTIKIVRDKQSGKAKGYSFIEMADRAAAENVVIALDKMQVKDKVLTVTIVEDKPVHPAASHEAGRQEHGDKKRRPRLPR